LFSVVTFSLLYLVMLVGYVVYIARAMRIGPERDDPDEIVRARSISPRFPVSGVVTPRLTGRG
jgi:cytochrome d ubiquinol oxidase subunit I